MGRTFAAPVLSVTAAVCSLAVSQGSIARADEDDARPDDAQAPVEAEPPPSPERDSASTPITPQEPPSEFDPFLPDADVPIDRQPRRDPARPEEESEEHLDRWMHGHLDDDRIAAGSVSGWYHELGRAMGRAFRPDRRAVLAERRAGMSFADRVLDELDRQRRPPSRPIDPGGFAPGTLFGHTREQEVFDQSNPLNAPVRWTTVDVRVVQSADGAVQTLTIIQGSGSRTLDRAALEAVRAGALRAPPPPADVRGERATITSEWRFELGDVATRWTLHAGVVGDLGNTEGEGYVAGTGLTRSFVHLLRVVDARHPTFDERRDRRERSRR